MDESIIKNATFSRAKENSVVTRRLPIQELSRSQTGYAPVLSINQVRAYGSIFTPQESTP